MPTKKESKQEYEKRVKWFRDAGLGMFMHWGLYSTLGHGEWAQWREDIHPRNYMKLMEKFTGKNFNASKLAQLAKQSGAQYAVLTSRHHDGFCLWDSQVSDLTSINTPAKRDFIAEYVDAFRQAGLKVGIYYSPMDWSWGTYNMDLPEEDPLAWQNFVEKGPEYDSGAWKRFRKYVHEQVWELMSNYGKIDLLWYDGCWYQNAEQWQSRKLNNMVRNLQPDIVINDRSGIEEDYSTPENEIPLNIQPQQRPWETCFCMNDTWGYIPGDKNIKTVRQCLYSLLRVRSAGGNLLLNNSLKPDGQSPADAVKVFEVIGNWLKINGESIYGASLAEMTSHGTGFFAQPGIVTAKQQQNTVYYHILRYLGGNEHCVKLDAEVISANLLLDGSKVKFNQKGRMVYFKNLPQKAPDSLDTVIKLKYKPGTARSIWTKTYV